MKLILLTMLALTSIAAFASNPCSVIVYGEYFSKSEIERIVVSNGALVASSVERADYIVRGRLKVIQYDFGPSKKSYELTVLDRDDEVVQKVVKKGRYNSDNIENALKALPRLIRKLDC